MINIAVLGYGTVGKGTVTLLTKNRPVIREKTGLDLFVFAMNQDGAPASPGAARLYYLRLSQGDPDGSNMELVRNLRPVRLSNGLVALWDFVEKKPYLPQLVSSSGTYVQFPVVGPDGEKVTAPFTLIIR